ncbi:MAG: hypothetical protein CMJ78_24185 [Planctomycetaceae bacterium]|nr:hypothetical protein [Planctomycetaceae bacterium]
MRRILVSTTTVGVVAVALLLSQTGFDSAKQPKTDAVHSFGAIQPRLSGDGKQVCFSYQGSIWTMPVSTGSAMTAKRLTSGEGFDLEPAWSPDGSKIAFMRTPNYGTGLLTIVDAKSGKAIKLPNTVVVRGTVVYYKLDFHPDGKRILGVLNVDQKNVGLAWYNIETGDVQTLIADVPRWSRFALSQDGKQIAYTETMDVQGQQMGNDGHEADVWLVSANGGEPRKCGRFSSRIFDLCWSADGESLFATTDVGGVHNDVWEIPIDVDKASIDEASARKLTFGQADEDRPSVSRDGQWLLYSDNQRGLTALTSRHLPSGVSETLTVADFDHGEPTGTFTIDCVDADTRNTVTARISLKHEGGKYYSPIGTLPRVLKGFGHFYCDGKQTLTVPAGKYRLKAFRGPEYKVTEYNFEIKPGQNDHREVHLNRWAHPQKDGWYSGENHIHANYGYGEWYNSPETMARQSSGENINVSNFVVANSDGNGTYDREFFRGGVDPNSRKDCILYWNQEFRSTIWGHLTLVNLNQLVEPIYTGFKNTTNPWDIPTNSDIADKTHWQNGLVNYTHVAQNPADPYQNPYTGKSIPIDVALGKIDTLDLNATYAGTTVLWYKLLNCGFRLTASAGTDCFLNRIRSRVPGGDRVYVKIDRSLTYKKWIEGLRSGRSIVSNGPMLKFTANDKGIGSTLKIDSSSVVNIIAEARANFPMQKLEVLYNGKVIREVTLDGDKLAAKIADGLKLKRSGWIAVRAYGPTTIDHPTSQLYAHTSPIYVVVDGKPAGSREDAEYFLKWIDRLSLAVRLRDRIPTDELRKHVDSQFDAARDVYADIAEKFE